MITISLSKIVLAIIFVLSATTLLEIHFLLSLLGYFIGFIYLDYHVSLEKKFNFPNNPFI